MIETLLSLARLVDDLAFEPDPSVTDPGGANRLWIDIEPSRQNVG